MAISGRRFRPRSACQSSPAEWYGPLEVWKAWADDVRGAPVRSGHLLPEEAPEESARHLVEFLSGDVTA